MLTTAFWPDGQSVVSLDRAVAQEDLDLAGNNVRPASTSDFADRFAEAELRKRLDVEFIELPIVEALDFLSNQVGLQFYLKVKYLEDLGISADSPVDLSLNQVSVEMALDLILEQLELTYIICDGIVLVTTEQDLENVAVVRVYNCRDLLAINTSTDAGEGNADGDEESEFGSNPIGASPPGSPRSGNKQQRRATPGATPPASNQSNAAVVPRNVLAQLGSGGFGGNLAPQPRSRDEQLMGIITTAVVPESWSDMGGPGTIAEFDGLIVIRHNPRIHRQVERVLEMLRKASEKQAWVGEHSFGQRNIQHVGGGGFF